MGVFFLFDVFLPINDLQRQFLNQQHQHHLLEMQIVGPYPGTPESEILGAGLNNNCPGNTDAHTGLRTTGLHLGRCYVAIAIEKAPYT